MSDGLSRQQKREMRQLKEDIGHVLDDPRGRRVLMWVLNLTGLYNPSFTGNSETFFREGKRSVGLHIVQELSAVRPMAYADLLRESVQRTQYKQLTEEDQEHDE